MAVGTGDLAVGTGLAGLTASSACRPGCATATVGFGPVRATAGCGPVGAPGFGPVRATAGCGPVRATEGFGPVRATAGPLGDMLERTGWYAPDGTRPADAAGSGS